MLQLPHQDSLIDQIVLNNQNVRLWTIDTEHFLVRMAFLEWWTGFVAAAGTVVNPLLGLCRSCLDKEPECRAFTVFGRDLDTTAH